MRHLFLLFIGLLLLPLCSMAQQRTIRGQITDAAEKTPLPGVNITAKGTSVGVVSDAQGNFLLNLPAGATTLIVSSVGFNSQEITVGTRAEIDVVLVADTKQLSEVVVTAVGIAREKKALGYSVTTISSDRLAQVSEPDPLRALTGKVAGVNVQGAGGAAGGQPTSPSGEIRRSPTITSRCLWWTGFRSITRRSRPTAGLPVEPRLPTALLTLTRTISKT